MCQELFRCWENGIEQNKKNSLESYTYKQFLGSFLAYKFQDQLIKFYEKPNNVKTNLNWVS